MYVGFAAAVLIFLPQYSYTPGLLIVTALAAGLLVIDDRRSMSPWVMFGVQAFLSLLAVVGLGAGRKGLERRPRRILQLALLMPASSAFVLLGVPVIGLAVPSAGTGGAIPRRARQKAPAATADLRHPPHRLQGFGLDPRQTCYVFYAASALLGALGLTLFGHGRVLAVVVVVTAVLVSTVGADLLQHAGWRVPAPFLRRLLGDPGSR